MSRLMNAVQRPDGRYPLQPAVAVATSIDGSAATSLLYYCVPTGAAGRILHSLRAIVELDQW